MKYGLVFTVLLLLFGLGFASVNPKLQLQNYTISELPAQPGHVAMLTLHIKSLEWDNCASRVSVQLITTYPLSVQGPDTQYVDSLCYNDTDAKGTFSFYIPVDSLAQAGTYQISVLTGYEKRYSKFSESNTINVRVAGVPSFTASVISSNPVDIYPGDAASITVMFQNNGSDRVESSRVTIETQGGIEAKWAGKTQELGEIPARGETTATFNIEAPKSINAGNYRFSVKLDYVSQEKTAGSETFYFDLPIKPRAEFAAAAPVNAPLLNEEDEQVTVVLKNTGSDEAKNLKVRIRPLFPFSTDGTVRFVDSLRPGEEKSLTYSIHVDKDATAGSQALTLLVDFEDRNGKKFSDSTDFSLPVKTKTVVDKLVELWYLGAIVLIIIAINVRKRMGGNGKKAKTG
jgi:hypothetical protein